MDPLTLALIGGGLGLLNGWGNSSARKAEFEDKKTDLERQQASLKENYSQAQSSYNLATENANAVAQENKDEYNLLADETLANRDTTLEQTATNGSMQSQVNAAQIATLAVQSKQSEGAANQSVATSGFRNTGTAMNLVENAKSSNADTMKQAKMQSKLANSQTFTQAVNNYTSANQQIDAYQRRVEQTESQLERDLSKLDLQMEQTKKTYDLQGGYLTADLETMNGKEAANNLWWAQAGDWVSGVVSGATSLSSFFKWGE